MAEGYVKGSTSGCDRCSVGVNTKHLINFAALYRNICCMHSDVRVYLSHEFSHMLSLWNDERMGRSILAGNGSRDPHSSIRQFKDECDSIHVDQVGTNLDKWFG